MLRVTIEVVPFGDEERARKLATVEIANRGGLAPISDYSIALDGEDVGGTRHERKRGFWPLVLRAIEVAHLTGMRRAGL